MHSQCRVTVSTVNCLQNFLHLLPTEILPPVSTDSPFSSTRSPGNHHPPFYEFNYSLMFLFIYRALFRLSFSYNLSIGSFHPLKCADGISTELCRLLPLCSLRSLKLASGSRGLKFQECIFVGLFKCYHCIFTLENRPYYQGRCVVFCTSVRKGWWEYLSKGFRASTIWKQGKSLLHVPFCLSLKLYNSVELLSFSEPVFSSSIS